MWRVALVALVAAGQKPSIGGKSVYFLVTDRFARSGAQKEDYEYCDLATSPDPYLPGGGAWCNGTLQGVIDRLDYIHGMGFECIWITPVVKSLDYTGYFAEDFFAVDPHLGTKETLKDLSRELHQRGMCLIIDIVANHVRQMTVRPDYSEGSVQTYIGPKGINPFDKEEYFHTYGKSPATTFEDFVMNGPAQVSSSQGSNEALDKRVEQGLSECGPGVPDMTECNCFPGNFPPACPGYNENLQVEGWFGQLADLDQNHPYVRQKLLEYVRYLVREYDVDAFRLDTAIYMPKDFLADLQEAAGVEILGETTVNNISYHAGFQEVLAGLLNFPAFYQIHGSFCQYHLGGDLGNYRLQGAFTPELPDLRSLATVMGFQNPNVYRDLDLMGNFVDNHDEFARISYYCDGDSFRIKNALTLLFFARGVPILYYGTEQGLAGHQANVLDRAALKKAGKENKGQAFVRESLWQSRYNTSTWQYEYIRLLNQKRKELGLAQPGIDSKIVAASYNHLIFKRTQADGNEIWIFVNNNQNWTGGSPFLYCPAPNEHESWYDVMSGTRAYLRNGCYMADNAEPRVLVRKQRMLMVYGVERISEYVWILWAFVFLLLCCNSGLCIWIFKHRLFGHRFKILEDDASSDSDDRC